MANTCSFVDGRIIAQQETFSKTKRNWTNPVNALQEAIYYSFKNSAFTVFTLVRIFCALLRVEKNYKHGLDADPLEFPFLRPMGYLTYPLRTLSLCFRVIGKTPALILRNNFVKKNFVSIALRDNVLARCDSIFPFLRCPGVWNKTCTQLSLSQILLQNPKNYSLVDVQRFFYHS